LSILKQQAIENINDRLDTISRFGSYRWCISKV